MFRADPPPLRSLGLVATRTCRLNDLLHRRDFLAARGWQVRLLALDRSVAAALGPDCLDLSRCSAPPSERDRAFSIPHAHGDGPCEASDRLRLALESLDFAIIEFPCHGGLAYRAIQARRAGLAFSRTRLSVRLEATSDYLRHQSGRWPDDPADLEADHAERYAFEHACVQILGSDDLNRHVRNQGWPLRPDAISPSDDYPPLSLDLPSPTRQPLVTICVPHYNLGAHLPSTLESLAVQTYPHLEVLVIDDGSTDASSRSVFSTLSERYPRFRFLQQENAGIGATRNRGLREASGEYFLPMDADNIAHPHMVERFVSVLERRPDLAALSCYFLAFSTDADLHHSRFTYAYRPTGGPHLLASLRNVYGDATALYRTDAFRSVGGYETDRGTSFEDWEAFVKLVHAGFRLDVLPEHLFYYRHLATGFSRTTNAFANQQRVLRQFTHGQALSDADRRALWNLLTGVHLRLEQLDARQRSLRYRLVDRFHSIYDRVPLARRMLRWLATFGRPPRTHAGQRT